jgi:hypothetical protein
MAWHAEAFGPEAENNLVSGEIADPNGNQICNVLKFTFPLDPQLPFSESSAPHPTSVSIGEEHYFAIDFK